MEQTELFPSATLASRLADVEEKIEEQRKVLEDLHDQKNYLLSQTPLTCPKCSTEHQIKELTYIQTHWYVPPRGCTEGDYWNEGEGQYDCPDCKARLRLYNLPEIMALKRLFKGVVDEHKH